MCFERKSFVLNLGLIQIPMSWILVQRTCLILHILSNGAVHMNKKHDLLAQFDMWYLACFVLITFSKVGLLLSIHPSSCELSLNNELAAYAVLSLRGMGKLQAAAGSVSRHLPSLHVDPGICRLVRWLSHVWLSSSICHFCRLPGGPSGGSADVSVITWAFLEGT